MQLLSEIEGLVKFPNGVEGVRGIVGATIKSVNEEKRTIEFIASTEIRDRMGEVIEAGGWKLKEFKDVGSHLWAHLYDFPPIGTPENARVVDKQLIVKTRFAKAEIFPFAELIYQLHLDNILKTVSVGFMPIEWVNGDGEKEPHRTYKKQTLLELSSVPVPANPEARIRAKGIISNNEARSIWNQGADMILDLATKSDWLSNKAWFDANISKVPTPAPHGADKGKDAADAEKPMRAYKITTSDKELQLVGVEAQSVYTVGHDLTVTEVSVDEVLETNGKTISRSPESPEPKGDPETSWAYGREVMGDLRKAREVVAQTSPEALGLREAARIIEGSKEEK